MTDDGVQQTDKPRQTRKRTRRNYARELQQTEARIEAALRVLRRAGGPGTHEEGGEVVAGPPQPVVTQLIAIAIETLEGR